MDGFLNVMHWGVWVMAMSTWALLGRAWFHTKQVSKCDYIIVHTKSQLGWLNLLQLPILHRQRLPNNEWS